MGAYKKKRKVEKGTYYIYIHVGRVDFTWHILIPTVLGSHSYIWGIEQWFHYRKQIRKRSTLELVMLGILNKNKSHSMSLQ